MVKTSDMMVLRSVKIQDEDMLAASCQHCNEITTEGVAVIVFTGAASCQHCNEITTEGVALIVFTGAASCQHCNEITTEGRGGREGREGGRDD